MQASDPCESIPDSEGEEEEILKAPTAAQPTVTSTISQFTAPDVRMPAEISSPVSLFTADKEKPTKGVRVRPQPRKPRLDESAIESFASSSSLADPSGNDIFEKEVRERQARVLKMKGWTVPSQSKSLLGTMDHVDAPLRDESSPGKEIPQETDVAPPMRSSLPNAPVASPLPPSDPPSSSSAFQIANVPSSSRLPFPPESSPMIVAQSKKRQRALAEDDNYVRSSDPEIMEIDPPPRPSKPPLSTASDKPAKKKQEKSKRPRQKKSSDPIEGETTAKPKRPKPAPLKKRNNTEESTALYKSAEFIFDTSDDEIALQPKSSTVQKSDPPSANVSAPPTMQLSVPPSIPSTSRPSTHRVSDPPSADGSAPPTMQVSDPPTMLPATRPSPSRPVSPISSRVPGKGKHNRIAPSDTEEEEILPRSRPKPSKRLKTSSDDSDAPAPVGKKKKIPATGSKESGRKTVEVEAKSAGKKKARRLASDSEESDSPPSKPTSSNAQNQGNNIPDEADKENTRMDEPSTSEIHPAPTPTVSPNPRPSARPRTSTPYMVPRKGSMSDLIRRANSKVNSPLASPAPAYSPIAKSSRSVLSRIAPLHVSRRTPPPPPPRPPPPKKTKKMLELEEKWEMELADTVEGWSCLPEEERASMMRAKRDLELGYED